MNEEIRNRNNELSDAALEQVSGGGKMEEEVQRICAACLSRKYPGDYSCTYEGGDWMLLYRRMDANRMLGSGTPKSNLCPYLRKL